MEPVRVFAKPVIEDGYGDDAYGPVPDDAEPIKTLRALVAPNHDPQRIAVGRDSTPVAFDIYYRGPEPTGLDADAHIVEVRGDRYEVDVKPAEWYRMSGAYVGDHFTVTATIN